MKYLREPGFWVAVIAVNLGFAVVVELAVKPMMSRAGGQG